MPRNYFIPRELPPHQPDMCKTCPMCGLIPKEERRRGLRESYYCLGVYEALKDKNGMPVLNEDGDEVLSFRRLKSKHIGVSAKARKEKGHLLHRPCDYIYKAWMQLKGRQLAMRSDVYIKYRLPYEHEQQRKMQPKFLFRNV